MSRRNDARSPWRRLRDLEPPLGSQQRVLARVEEDLFAGAPRGRRMWIGGGLVAAAAVGVFAWWGLRGPSAPLAIDVERTVAAISEGDKQEGDKQGEAVGDHDGQSGETSQALGDDASDLLPALALDAGAETPIVLPRGRVVVSGTSSVRISENAVILSEGRVVVSGFAHIKTPGCRARIDGDAEVRVGGDVVDIRVSRGSADVSPGCHVKYVALAAKASGSGQSLGTPLDNPHEASEAFEASRQERPASSPKPQTAVRPSESLKGPAALPPKVRKKPIAATTRSRDPGERAPPEHAPPTVEPPTTPPSTSSRTAETIPKAAERSELRKQVDEFRRARRVAAGDAREGLLAYDEFLRRWPRSPLRPEVEAERKRAAARQSP